MRVTQLQLRQIISQELGLKITERRSRDVVGGEDTPGAATSGAIERKVIPQSSLEAVHEDRVKMNQEFSLSGDREFKPDLFGLSDEDKLHELAEELGTGAAIGVGGSLVFTPWQPWSQARQGETKAKITWTLLNNVSGHDGVPDSRAFYLMPSVIGLKTTEDVEEEEEEAQEDYSDQFEAGLDKAHAAAKGMGTTMPDFDEGLKSACAAWTAAGGLSGPLRGVADGYISAKGSWDSVNDMITGEFSGGDEDERLLAWEKCQGIYVNESKITPGEIWEWERSGLGMLLEQAKTSQTEEVDPENLNLSSDGMEMYIERVEEILEGYPNIGWGHRDNVELPSDGGGTVPGIAYFFSKTSAAEAESLRIAGAKALKKIAAAKERDTPDDRAALNNLYNDALSSRGISSEKKSDSEGDKKAATNESLVRSTIRQQLMIERRQSLSLYNVKKKVS